MDIFDIANARVNRITRWFRVNDGVKHATIPLITLTGDFEIDFLISDANAGLAGGFTVILGLSADNSDYFTITGAGALRLTADTVSVQSADGVISDTDLNRIKITRASNTVTIFLNGVSVASGTISTNISFDFLYRRSGGQYFAGTIANLTVIDNGSLIRNYPINEPSGTTIFDEVSGQDGTIVIGSNDDRGLFQEASKGGDWQGSGLTVPPWASVSQILVVA